jgi:hypothetical protein
MNEAAHKILDRSNYPRETIVTYEVISTYFVDLYYNHLYLEAKKLRVNNSVTSVTEGYKHALNAFLKSMEKPELYKKCLSSLHQYFIDSGFDGLFGNFIERITKEFIPNDYYETVTNKQRYAILRLVLTQANKMYIDKIVRKYIYMIIDNHSDIDNIQLLKNDFNDLLFLEREGMYHRFVATKTKTNKRQPHINTALMESMQEELRKLYVEKFNLKKMITDLKKIILTKDAHTKELQDKVEELEVAISELRAGNELRVEPVEPVDIEEPAEELPCENKEIIREFETALQAHAPSEPGDELLDSKNMIKPIDDDFW